MNNSDEQFLAVGDQTLRQLQSWAGLTESSSVVDIGCGYGRLAHALLRWGAFHGKYLGLDILPNHLRWCAKNLAKPAPGSFDFKRIDIQNDRYNPRGSSDAATTNLPVQDATADVVVFLSVFTHMYPDQISNYLKETQRMLSPEGYVFATFLLLNESWERLASEGKPAYPLRHELGDHAYYMNERDPLHAIGYREEWVVNQFALAGLSVALPGHYGSWAGRGHAETFQDLVVARKDPLP